MRQMTISDFIKGPVKVGEILDPTELGNKLTFHDLESMQGETICVKEENKKKLVLYRAVKVLDVDLPDDECSYRRLLYDNGNHTCVVLPEDRYSDSIFSIT